MEPIILIGGGGHCSSCIDVIEQEGKYSILGILDLNEKIGQEISGYKIIGVDDDIERLRKTCRNFVITIGQLHSAGKRLTIYKRVKELNVNLPVIISPYAYVSKHSVIGEGSIIMHFALVNAGAKIGVNCIINSKALVEHDSIIGDHCHVSTGAIINGGVKLGDRSFFGSGAVSKQYISIPADSFIKANSVVK
jgi:sugar O-acyltransferase (sialic acid O-acetyltransferase NeuD family)